MPLYRIWSKSNGHYMPLDAIYADGYGNVCTSFDDGDFVKTVDNQDDYVVERCSGLKDKNNQWIFEGDMLKTYAILSSETIDDKSFIVSVQRTGGYFISNGTLNRYQSDISEVIGTIHE